MSAELYSNNPHARAEQKALTGEGAGSEQHRTTSGFVTEAGCQNKAGRMERGTHSRKDRNRAAPGALPQLGCPACEHPSEGARDQAPRAKCSDVTRDVPAGDLSSWLAFYIPLLKPMGKKKLLTTSWAVTVRASASPPCKLACGQVHVSVHRTGHPTA